MRSSAVADYSHQTGHGVDWSHVKILACDYNEYNLFYLESLLIIKQTPTLNKMQTKVDRVYSINLDADFCKY